MKQFLESLVQRVRKSSKIDSSPADEGSGSLYVIVHDYILYEDGVDEENALVREEIERIRREENYREIGENDSPSKLPENMPPPSETLTVHVVGGYINLCVAFQLNTLRRAEYSAEIHSKGCF